MLSKGKSLFRSHTRKQTPADFVRATLEGLRLLNGSDPSTRDKVSFTARESTFPTCLRHLVLLRSVHIGWKGSAIFLQCLHSISSPYVEVLNMFIVYFQSTHEVAHPMPMLYQKHGAMYGTVRR